MGGLLNDRNLSLRPVGLAPSTTVGVGTTTRRKKTLLGGIKVGQENPLAAPPPGPDATDEVARAKAKLERSRQQVGRTRQSMFASTQRRTLLGGGY